MKIIKVLFVLGLIAVLGALSFSIYQIKTLQVDQRELNTAIIRAVNLQAAKWEKLEGVKASPPSKVSQEAGQPRTSDKKLPASVGSAQK